MSSQERRASLPKNTVLIKRTDFLKEDSNIEDSSEAQALNKFLKAIAGESHIQGVAFSHMRYGGIYTHVFVENLSDRVAMKRVLDITREGFDLLEQAAGDRAGPSSFVPTKEKSPEDFAYWFRGEFHKKPVHNPNSDEGVLNIFHLAGASKDLKLRAIVMFTDQKEPTPKS